MRWKKPSRGLLEAFAAAVPRDRRVQRRRMFGLPCAFVQGQMFTGLHEERLVVRLSEPDRRALLAIPGARRFEPLPGRVMREYVVVPPRIVADSEALREWMARALAYARSLPPKRGRIAVRRPAAKRPRPPSRKAAPKKAGAAPRKPAPRGKPVRKVRRRG